MQVITKRPFNEAAIRYPNQRQALEDLYHVLRKNIFKSPHEMKNIFSSLDNFKYRDAC